MLVRQRFQIIGQAQGSQFAVDVADAVDAVDDFLSDVAALVVNDGAAFNAAFERNICLVHVRPVSRNARLNARGLECLPTDRASANRFRGGNQFVRHRTEGIIGDEQIETLIGRARHSVRADGRQWTARPTVCSIMARMVHQINFTERGVRKFHRIKRLGRNY